MLTFISAATSSRVRNGSSISRTLAIETPFVIHRNGGRVGLVKQAPFFKTLLATFKPMFHLFENDCFTLPTMCMKDAKQPKHSETGPPSNRDCQEQSSLGELLARNQLGKGQETTMQLAIIPPPTSMAPTSWVIPEQAENDAGLVKLWLHGRPATTRSAYERDARVFFLATGKPMQQTTVGDVQAWLDTLGHFKSSSRARRFSAIKSMFSFAQRVGYLHFNVCAVVRIPAVRDELAQRIVPEAAMHRMLALTPPGRDHVVVRLFYASGMRLSEVAGLRWSDCTERDDGGQLTVFGKGGRTRQVLIPATVWTDLQGLRGTATDADPIFASRMRGRGLCPRMLALIVKAAAVRAGLPAGFSPHWCRHAHASHALDRGAPVHVVSSTLGHASLATTSRYAHARPNVSSGQWLAL